MTRAELQHIVETEGLQRVAEAIGYSKGAVCHVLRENYKGRPDKILKAAEEKYSRAPVDCPVLGEIPLSQCVAERSRPFAAVNPIRVALAKTCKRCEKAGLRPER